MASATPDSKKAEAFRMLDAGENQSTVARAVGVDSATVCRWVAKRNGRATTPRTNGSAPAANGNGAAVLPLARPAAPPDDPIALRARIRELEARERELSEECACLRKAVGYVARGGK